MPYATLQHLTDAYGERLLIGLTDRGEIATGAVDVGVVDKALEDTDALIDGYLAGRYGLPLATVPHLVRVIAQQIAIYKLHIAEPDPKIDGEYKAALTQLGQIAAGTIRLPVAGVEPATKSGNGVRVTDRERPFTEANMKGLI